MVITKEINEYIYKNFRFKFLDFKTFGHKIIK